MDTPPGGTGDSEAGGTAVNFAVAFISDRGDLYLPRCSESLHMNLVPDGLRVVDDHDHHLGMAGAVREAWTWAVDLDVDFLFHVEEDFTFNERVDIAGMAALLDAYPRLAQIVLKRQPWNEQEHAAGGIIEANPDAYRQQAGFVEHREIFSLNPCQIGRAHV